MTKTIDFYFAVISSYAYLAAPRLGEIAQRTGASINFKPVNIGKVFESSETTPPAKQSDARKAYRAVDQARIAKAHDLPINLKPAFWPVPMELPSGMVIAIQNDSGEPMALTQALLSAIWAEDKNIADEETLIELATSCGYDGGDLLTQAKSDAIQAVLEANTAEAIEKGVFGSPTFIVDGELFWGQDRLDYVEAAL